MAASSETSCVGLPPRPPNVFQAMASHDMERPAARESGTGTLSVRRSRDSRGTEHGTISRTSSSSRMGSGRSTPTEQLEGPGARDMGRRRESLEDVSSSDGGRGRFEGPARAGGGLRAAESSRSGGGGGGGGGTSRGSKRGRSADPDRGGGREARFDADGGGDGDPSQAFDSKRMRQPDPAMLELEGRRVAPPRSSVEGWGRGYGGGGGVPREREREREGPAAPDDGSSGRYRDEAIFRHDGAGGGSGMPVRMPPREVHMDRLSHEARGGGRAGRSAGGLDAGGEGQDRDRSGGHHGARGDREHPHDDDARSRSSREGKKSRSDRQRSGGSRGEDGGGVGGGSSSRKEKKKSSKSKKKKH